MHERALTESIVSAVSERLAGRTRARVRTRPRALLLLNKVDLLSHLAFDVERCLLWARQVNPRLEVQRISALTGDGLPPWLDWLRRGAAVAARA